MSGRKSSRKHLVPGREVLEGGTHLGHGCCFRLLMMTPQDIEGGMKSCRG